MKNEVISENGDTFRHDDVKVLYISAIIEIENNNISYIHIVIHTYTHTHTHTHARTHARRTHAQNVSNYPYIRAYLHKNEFLV